MNEYPVHVASRPRRFYLFDDKVNLIINSTYLPAPIDDEDLCALCKTNFFDTYNGYILSYVHNLIICL
jgi:hypothetical protein